jgi:hypothetical protein
MMIWRNGLIPITILAIWSTAAGARLQANESATSGHTVRIRSAVYTRVLGNVAEPSPMKLIQHAPATPLRVTTVGWRHHYYYGGYGPAYGWYGYHPHRYYGASYGYYPGYYAPYGPYYGYYTPYAASYAPYAPPYAAVYAPPYRHRYAGWAGCSYW